MARELPAGQRRLARQPDGQLRGDVDLDGAGRDGGAFDWQARVRHDTKTGIFLVLNRVFDERARGRLVADGDVLRIGEGGAGRNGWSNRRPKPAPRQTPFPVLPLPHFFPHLAVAERGAP